MLPSQGAQRYQEASVQSASPERLIGLLYAEALRCLAEARDAVSRGDESAKRRWMRKSVDVLAELLGSLNMQHGQGVAAGLATLYEYLAKRLLQAHCDENTEPFDEIIGLLTPIKDAWDHISHASGALPGAGT
ncbi:MAG: flagellar export chaperone FliS [Nitrospirae bacterium]|nr:flagellar export chaperone FliS [Nitrospirota bacterium]